MGDEFRENGTLRENGKVLLKLFIELLPHPMMCAPFIACAFLLLSRITPQYCFFLVLRIWRVNSFVQLHTHVSLCFKQFNYSWFTISHFYLYIISNMCICYALTFICSRLIAWWILYPLPLMWTPHCSKPGTKLRETPHLSTCNNKQLFFRVSIASNKGHKVWKRNHTNLISDSQPFVRQTFVVLVVN